MASSPFLFLLLPLCGLGSLPTNDPVVPKLHPYLRERMASASSDQMLPAYFVMREKLHYEDFLPRILRLDKETRRAMVIRELRAHMERTQRELVTYLEAEEEAGNVVIVSRNYLGNFVRVQAKPDVIHFGAAFETVEAVWFDSTPPAEEVEDAAASAPMAPGNGPLDTRSHLVWAQGIRGQGILWMNSDSGCRVTHPGLSANVWQNPAEVGGTPGVDDDNNGFVDDFNGWNFSSNSNNVDDRGGHGTNTTGVFVGIDSNGDTLGNCPDTRIMIGALGGETTQWDAIQYGIDNGADGQTSSHSYKLYFNPPPNYKMHRDVGEASMAVGMIRTNSTSNDGSSCNSTTSAARRPFNMSAPGNLPAPWIHPDQTLVGGKAGVLGIGAHTVGTTSQPSYTPCGPFAWYWNDLLVNLPGYPAANWDQVNDNDYPWQGGARQGLIKPDLTGPTGTRTTSGSTSYTTFSGTSNATPSVSSCLALALSANPSLTPEDMAMAAMTSAVDQGAPGKDNAWGAGRVDAWELTKLCRAIHRINGDVSHTVDISVSAPNSWDVELDSIPSTSVVLILGTIPANTVIGSFTLRIADPVLIGGITTDAQGNYSLSLPTVPGLIGISILSQFGVPDPLFGPFTGSNAIRSRFVL